MSRLPSVKTLQKEFGMTLEDACKLREFMDKDRDRALEFFDNTVNNHGIEFFEAKVYGRNTFVLYSNAGDSYNTTLLYVTDCRGSRWRIGCWADIAEKAL